MNLATPRKSRRRDPNTVMPLIPLALGEEIRRLATIAQISPDRWVIEALEDYIREHRRGKPPILDPERYADRETGDFESICL